MQLLLDVYWHAMAEVFISYSRKDGSFVRKLDETLAAADRKAWVD